MPGSSSKDAIVSKHLKVVGGGERNIPDMVLCPECKGAAGLLITINMHRNGGRIIGETAIACVQCLADGQVKILQ